jgi:hypothetical protein
MSLQLLEHITEVYHNQVATITVIRLSSLRNAPFRPWLPTSKWHTTHCTGKAEEVLHDQLVRDSRRVRVKLLCIVRITLRELIPNLYNITYH